MEDPFKGFIKDYSSSVQVQKTKCEVVVKVCNFSSENFFQPEQLPTIEYYTYSIYFKNYFWLKVYQNGMSNADKGYISIYFSGSEEYNSVNIIKYFKFDCVISVLDVLGNKRHSQSFIYEFSSSPLSNNNMLPVFGFDKFISHGALLREPSEYLLDDTLTIHIDVNMQEHIIDLDYTFDVSDLAVLESAFKTEIGPDGSNRKYLSLDSVLAKCLYLASCYFRDMSNAQMLEKSSRYVYIPDDEYPYFINIWLILKECPFMIDKHNFDISKLYAIADKYDFPHITAVCRNLLETYISFENVEDISELAEKYNDVYLREAIKNFKKINEENAKSANSTFNLQPVNLKMEWCSKPLGMYLEAFHYSASLKEQSTNDNDEDFAFSFYS